MEMEMESATKSIDSDKGVPEYHDEPGTNHGPSPLRRAQLAARNFFEGMVERKVKRAFKITDHMELPGCEQGRFFRGVWRSKMGVPP